jgi:hypothetical protein
MYAEVCTFILFRKAASMQMGDLIPQLNRVHEQVPKIVRLQADSLD